MLSALYNKWKDPVVWGMEKPKKPDMICLNNSIEALEMLHKHITDADGVVVHCDVDMDGIGSGYIFKKFVGNITACPTSYMINKEKEHGVKQRHVEFLNQYKLGLLVILDSSSNEIDVIKQFNCDVLVVDHHEVDHTEYSGYTNSGHRFLIVNNMISNSDSCALRNWLRTKNPDTVENIEPYEADSRMSCGLVIYELLRLYQEAYMHKPLLENLMLFQWVGVTLFTDAIQLLTERNQWYIDSTVHNNSIEPNLQAIMRSLNSYATGLDKSLINYTIAPTFNRAIRAGKTQEAMHAVMTYPNYASSLSEFRAQQDAAIKEGSENPVEGSTYALKDLTGSGISNNYTGVIASKICDTANKNCVVYNVFNGIARGSFRGRQQSVDYRSVFNEFGNGVKAQGHSTAFGFECPVEHLENVMSELVKVENASVNKPYLTAGCLPENLRGEYHISDVDAFKKNAGLLYIGAGNSKVGSNEQIVITVNAAEAKLLEVRGKLYLYDVLGMTCKAFKEIDTSFINIYPEYSKSLELYIK